MLGAGGRCSSSSSFSPFPSLSFFSPLLSWERGKAGVQGRRMRKKYQWRKRTERAGGRREGGRPHSVSARLLAGLAGGVCICMYGGYIMRRGGKGEGETELWRAVAERRLRFHQPFLGMCRHDWTQPETCVNHLLSVMRNSRRILVLWEFPFPRMSVGERERESESVSASESAYVRTVWASISLPSSSSSAAAVSLSPRRRQACRCPPFASKQEKNSWRGWGPPTDRRRRGGHTEEAEKEKRMYSMRCWTW